MLSKLIERAEHAQASFWAWAAGFSGILFIRFFLENFSSPTQSFPAVPDTLTLVHYFLFYSAVLLSLSLVIRIFIPDIPKITKFLLFGLPIIWTPPIIDLIRSEGHGFAMAYIFARGASLAESIFTLGGSYDLGGITPGIKVELVAIMIGVFIYVFIKMKSVLRALLAAAASYLAIFFWLALPSLIALITGVFGGNTAGLSPANLLLSIFSLAHSTGNFIRPTVQLSYDYTVETIFNIGISYFYYLAVFALIVGWFALVRPDIVRAFWKNCRPIRTGYYFSLLISGVLIAVKISNGPAFANWIDGAGFLGLLLAFFCAWMFAVGTNDLADVKIDRVSNGDRPLVSGSISESEMKGGNIFFLFWAILGGYIGGYWTLFAILVFTAAYYIYSAPPLRLKKIPVLSTFLISLASTSALMAGFYFGSSSRTLMDFPAALILLVVVFITLGANIKDLKDVDGDRADQIWTIPVLFGKRAGAMIIGTLVVASALATPIILGSPSIFLPSLIAAAFGYFFVVAEEYREWRLFVLYFIYIATIGAILWLS